MSKKVFNPYRDMLDIPSLTDENPTDYQLLGIDDFEGDPNMIAAAHVKRMERIAELYQLITKMSQQIDGARDRISDPRKKQEYDSYLMKMGIAGLPKFGKLGSFSLLFSFVLSIVIVIISIFYIYPMVVPAPAENIGDSVTTLPDYNETQNQKDIDILKKQQEDISTMDVNLTLPIDVDSNTSDVDFVDVPLTETPADEKSVDELPDVDAPLTEQPAAPEEPAVEEPAAPEVPAVEEPAAPEPIELEAPDVEPPAGEESAVDQPAEAAIVKPSEESPDIIVDPGAPETPSVPDVPDVPADLDAPTVPKTSSLDNAGIPELPPLEEMPGAGPQAPKDEVMPPKMPGSMITASNQEPTLSGAGPHAPKDEVIPPKMPGSMITASNQEPTLSESEPPIAPEPPMIPELSTASVAGAIPNIEETVTAEALAAPSNVVLEDVDKFVQLGQKAHTDADFVQLIVSARQAEEDLMKEKMFQNAQQIADVVYTACARSADKTHRSEAYRSKELVAKRSAWWDAVQSAQAKLDSDGTLSSKDATIIAQWTIEIENDWETGLKYLAMSENEQVRNAAKNEILANQSDVRSVLTIANSWWNLAQDPVPMQRHFRAHASDWYAKALPSIADKQIRTLVEKRISMAEQAVGSRK